MVSAASDRADSGKGTSDVPHHIYWFKQSLVHSAPHLPVQVIEAPQQPQVADHNPDGELGKAFIHVHHIKPLAEIKDEYVVNPVLDLVPLCANCHAMVHRVNPALPVEMLKAELKC
ncbi:MAG: hypothetical protein EOO81_07890 [Oxalobacteraceae bacterium]|nr:MAG: hypothetical protein EOO81_07890 [Oxalobacteraceae bacterium]